MSETNFCLRKKKLVLTCKKVKCVLLLKLTALCFFKIYQNQETFHHELLTILVSHVVDSICLHVNHTIQPKLLTQSYIVDQENARSSKHV